MQIDYAPRLAARTRRRQHQQRALLICALILPAISWHSTSAQNAPTSAHATTLAAR